MKHSPVVLDLDNAVGPLTGECRIALQDWQETMRFGCGLSHMRALTRQLETLMPPATQHGPVLMGSGDFHHLSWPLVVRCMHARGGPRSKLRVVVLDNHPDNMRFPFGVHCGSWIRRIAMLPEVEHVHVAGITSGDIGLWHSWENQLAPLRIGKLSYWSIGVNTDWARWLGIGSAFRNFDSSQSLADELATLLHRQRVPTYLSIDKDVFSPDVVRTNWDQGSLQEAQANQIIDALKGQLDGSDITGEVSSYRYRTAWKRWLSAQDGQDTIIAPAQLTLWQAEQDALNQRLVARLQKAQGWPE
ncbi:Arginase family protein [Variovorax boronicumulans]|uniref:hypothetical protein n=1 Tax=Variovorax boronicumulans TaxID=436515 RepID=UPI000BB2E39E|nr:hypothetical protein [Variovorax boronicumulans]PBI89300.1 Arginase family protein [Variovorax boronicumulans]